MLYEVITVSGPVIQDKLFFFINGELERRDGKEIRVRRRRPAA